MYKLYLHLFLFFIKLYKLPWIPFSIISNSYSLIFNNIGTTYSNRYHSNYVGYFLFHPFTFHQLTFRVLLPSSFFVLILLPSIHHFLYLHHLLQHYHQKSFPAINYVLLEKYDLMVVTGRYSSGVKVFLNCFSPCTADNVS